MGVAELLVGKSQLGFRGGVDVAFDDPDSA